jgi:hypothetical protein
VKLLQPPAIFWRVADPEWADPFDGAHSMRSGQRWNARGSFPIVYLNANMATATANARRLLDATAALGIDIDDFESSQLPVAVPCAVPECVVLDVVSDAGCGDLGLEVTYPLDAAGEIVAHSVCQPMGTAAWEQGLDGIACRSAALVSSEGRELAWFDRAGRRLTASGPVERLDLER